MIPLLQQHSKDPDPLLTLPSFSRHLIRKSHLAEIKISHPPGPLKARLCMGWSELWPLLCNPVHDVVFLKQPIEGPSMNVHASRVSF